MNLQLLTSNLQLPIRRGAAAWLMGLLLLFGIVGDAFAQKDLSGVAGGRGVFSRYHPAPNFRQMEMKLTGDQITGTNKQIRATNTEFWAFETNGATLVNLRTPVCFYDEANVNARTLSSPEKLIARSGDGKFQIEGRGFLWRHNERILIISNDVQAVIHWTNNAPPLVITSRWFEFDAAQGRGIFHNDVHGEDADRIFTCETLTVSGSMDKTKRTVLGSGATNRAPFDVIEADGGLVITGKSKPGHAKAQRGTFRQADQRVDLVGDAAWNFNGYSGSADRMTVWLNDTNIDAAGKVQLSLPRAGLGAAAGLWSATNATTRATDTNIVTLSADRFTKRGEKLLMEGAVRIKEGTNYLTCDKLEGKQATPQSPEEFATATGNVFVGRDNGGIYSDRAEYSKATCQVVFTGETPPRFVQGTTSGTAGRVIARPASGEVRAENGVTVDLTFASDSDTFLNVLPDTKTNRFAKTERTNQTVRVTAKTFALQDRLAVFAGNVEAHQLPVNGSEPRMRCGELEVRLTADKRHAESVQARQDVICERGTIGVTNGPAEYTRMDSETLTANANPTSGELIDLVAGGGVKLQRTALTARGEQAVYTPAQSLLKLMGQSVIDSPEATYTSSQGIGWHIAKEEVVGSFDKVSFKPTALKSLEESQKLSPP